MKSLSGRSVYVRNFSSSRPRIYLRTLRAPHLDVAWRLAFEFRQNRGRVDALIEQSQLAVDARPVGSRAVVVQLQRDAVRVAEVDPLARPILMATVDRIAAVE